LQLNHNKAANYDLSRRALRVLFGEY